jgi:hypothetical protein
VAGCILPIFAAGLEQLYKGDINVGFSQLIDCNRKETRGYSNQQGNRLQHVETIIKKEDAGHYRAKIVLICTCAALKQFSTLDFI